MILAKQHLDIGLQANGKTEMLIIWQRTMSAPFEEMLTLGAGMQHRHTHNGSVSKIDHSLLESDNRTSAGSRSILIARDAQQRVEGFNDPDGHWIEGSRGVWLAGSLS